ncbi:Methyltransferase-like protein 4 [Apophysomyces ossiformis]|uniref:Methyltransferase-like protein 4 n=1 Tax=Apophysomyces ossiformis TaxID=679940 RepID=A0A8H7EMZ5_9FUNG|nr:Methyltransferase-like protein 4 [Apophysomyces ossiformis]
MIHIVDPERALSYPGWTLRPGEFAVLAPYFRTNESQPRRKKQKQERSVTDIQTEEHHASIREWLTHCIEEAQASWPEHKATETISLEEDPPDIDFIGLLKLAERFMTFQREPVLVEQDKDCMTMDTLDLFHVAVSNPANSCRRIQLPDDTSYILPPQASFIIGDLHTSMDALVELARSKGGFDCVVLDPPWPNKSVHRSDHYETQDIYDLFTIPLPSMLRQDQCCLVVVWVTNKPKYRRFITDKLFKAWGVKWIADWYWIKMTTAGELVMPLDSPHRKPYEQIVVGHTCGKEHAIGSHAIASVPCRRHSRKPPLQDILYPLLRPKAQCLEMFARCLLPSWTSWGNECIKFQNQKYYVREENGEHAEPVLKKEK